MEIYKRLLLSAILATGAAVHAQADNDIGDTSPYITQQRDCITDGLNNPTGKEFRYLYSRDCRVAYVLPPPSVPQNIKGQGLNLELCSTLNSAFDAIRVQQDTIDSMALTSQKMEKQLAEKEDMALEARLKRLQIRLAEYRTEQTQALKEFHDNFDQVPGAEFSILMDDSVNSTDLNAIRALNQASLNRRVDVEIHHVGPMGQDQVSHDLRVIPSSVRPAPLDFSVFNFKYSKPSEVGSNGGLLTTDIPGLEYLDQPNSTTGTISVKANGAVAGKVVMSLPATCNKSTHDLKGKWSLNNEVDPMFVVNHTFSVQEMFGQGYTAKLRVDKVVDQLTTQITRDTDHGFQKSVTFNQDLVADLSDILDFTWVNEYTTDKNDLGTQGTIDVERAVATKLIDNYIEELTKEKILSPQDAPTVDPARGGMTTETGVANRCWSERNGGITGLFGGRHTQCGDYTYTYQVWHDGNTTEDVRKALTLKGEHSESMRRYQTVAFDFTTAFVAPITPIQPLTGGN